MLDAETTVTLTTPDGREADITALLAQHQDPEHSMATDTLAINEEAVDLLAGTCRERINEMIDDLLKYVDAGKAPGKMTLAITVGPVKDTPGAYWTDVVPSLAVKGMRSEGASTIEHVGKHLQLRINGLD